MKCTAKWIRIALCLLTLCLLVGTVAACTGDNNGKKNTGSGEQTKETVATGDPNDIDDVPTDLRFNTKFDVLGWTNQQNRTRPPEEANDDVSRAVMERNASIEERLNIELVWEFIPGQYDTSSKPEKTEFVKRIETDSEQTQAIDLVVAYNLVPYRMSYKGILTNLADTEYINLDKSWWPKEYLENMIYKESIFALVDNASVGTLQNMSCIYFNNTLLENKKIQSPYELVKNNNWTLSTLREITKDTYEDANRNDQKDVNDVFGICTSTAARFTCWYFGAGLRLSELNDQGEMVLTGSRTEEIDGVLSQIADLLSTPDAIAKDSSQYVMFKAQRACFYLSVFHMSESMNADELDINYGVAPNPKLNSEQTRYYTHLPNTHDAWCIPRSAPMQGCSSAVLELMAAESFYDVTYVYYEKNLKNRYAPDGRLADMYDLIRDNIVFDYVYIHKESSLGADFDNAMRACIESPNVKWIDKWNSIGESQEKKFADLMASYDSIIG